MKSIKLYSEDLEYKKQRSVRKKDQMLFYYAYTGTFTRSVRRNLIQFINFINKKTN